MKRTILVMFLLSTVSMAFSQAYEAKVEHQRKNHVAAVIEVPYPPDQVEDAIKEYMAKKGFKSNASKGVQTFKGVKLYAANASNNDIHFIVERKSRKEKESSLIHLVVSKEGETLAQRIPEDIAGLEDGKSFLNEMMPSLEAFNLEVEIGEQDKTVKKAEKKLENLSEDQQDLEKKIRNLQEKLEQNKKNQEAQRSEITNQKVILEGLKGKRKS